MRVGQRDLLALISRAPVVFVLALVVLVLRRPQATLTFEDGPIFYLGAGQDPLGSFIQPYAGYLHLVPRLVAFLERLLPYELAPLLGWLVSVAIVAGVAAFVARALPFSRPVRLAMAAGVVLLTNTDQTLGSITFIQFYLAIFLVAAAVARGPFRWLLVALAAASLTGPFGALFLPLYLARAWLVRDRDSALRVVAVGVPAAVQLGVALVNRAPSHPVLDVVDAVRIAAVHLDTMTFGAVWTWFGMQRVSVWWIGAIITVGVTLLIAAVALTVPRRALVVAGYVLAILLVSALWFGTDTGPDLLHPLMASRYFVVPTAMLGALAILSAAGRHRAGAILLGVLVFGAVADFRLPLRPDLDWSTSASCIGGPVACDVPIYPDDHWTIHWPTGS